MVIVSRGYSPQSDEITSAREFSLFMENLEMLLANQAAIFNCADYFFCEPSFAWCSWPYVGGDGPIPIGYLILSWQNGLLSGICPSCNGTVLVTSFGGSPISGSNRWSGICRACLTKVNGRWDKFSPQLTLIQQLRKEFPSSVIKVEEYDGEVFDWGIGLKRSRKTREVEQPVAEAVSLELLIEELKCGKPRKGKMPNVSILRNPLTFKFRK